MPIDRTNSGSSMKSGKVFTFPYGSMPVNNPTPVMIMPLNTKRTTAVSQTSTSEKNRLVAASALANAKALSTLSANQVINPSYKEQTDAIASRNPVLINRSSAGECDYRLYL